MAENNTFSAFQAAIKQKLDRLYVFSDGDAWFIDKASDVLRAAVVGDDDMNLSFLEGDTLTPEELADAVDTPPVFAEQKFIHVRRFPVSRLTAEESDLYLSILNDLPDYAVLLLVLADAPAKKNAGQSAAFLRSLSKLTTVYSFVTPPPEELTKLILRTFRAAEKEISPADASYFISLCAGSDTQTIMSEAKKLLSVPRPTVTREDITALVSLSPDAASYLMTNAVFNGDLPGALSIFRAQVKKGVSEYTLSSILFSDMRRYYAVKLGVAADTPSSELLSLLSIRENRLFVLRKIVARVDIVRLRRALSLCAENEHMLRSSSQDGVLLTETLLMKLCVLLGRVH